MHLERLTDYRKNKLDDMSIDEMQREMEAGNLTAEELVLMFHENIAERDQEINSIIEVNPEALLIAQGLDAERSLSGARSKLHGIPILLKDNIGTADSMHTSGGSYALKDYYALSDSTVAKKLRQAGAVLLGKTHMTEWADFMSDDMPNNYCSRSGFVQHPYGDYYVGGSSSGSAVATTLNLAAASIGTETSGSIINPSDENSLVGIKPTLGLISRTGIIPLAPTQDTAGPIAKTVEDAVAVLSVLIGADNADAITGRAKKIEDHDWSAHFNRKGLQGKTILVPRHLFKDSVTDNELALFEEALEAIKALGATIIDEVEIGIESDDAGSEIQAYEFKPAINAYLGNSHPENRIRSLDQLIEFHKANPEKMLKFGQSKLEKSAATTGRLKEPEYVEMLKRKRLLAAEQGISQTLSEHKAHAFILPKDFGGDVAAAAGNPMITVPYSFEEENGPFGITFIGQLFSDPQLVEYAYAFEQATNGRVKPPQLKTEK